MRHVLLLALLVSSLAAGHEIRPGLLEIVETSANDYRVSLKLPIRNGQPLNVTPVLPGDCVIGDVSRTMPVADQLLSTFEARCTENLLDREIQLQGLELLITDVLVRYESVDGKAQIQRATPDLPEVMFKGDADSLEVAHTYFILGMEHILLGIDHLLFVLALVLLITGVRRLVWTITAFTLAHSVTLVGTSLGFLSLPSAPVEAVIALSIVFLANEIAVKEPGHERLSERVPWIVAGAFGLLHGFGFAGALAEIGLPDGDIPLALFCFNVGVEAGQLLFVSVVLLVLHFIRRTTWWSGTERMTSYAIGITASFWLFQRILVQYDSVPIF